MRVAVTGSHGVGKTTVLTKLQEKLPDYTIQIESITRSAVDDSSKVNFGTVDETEVRITDAYRAAFYNAPEKYVVPRHMIDVMAYSIYLNKKNNNISPATFDYIEENIMELKSNGLFDLVLYIPIEFELIEGGDFRQGQEDLSYQRDVDIIIKYLLWKYEIPYTTISGTADERVDKMFSLINFAEIQKSFNGSDVADA